ncbi:sugar ABC transporter permease [Streptomyces sp. NPDC048636]|uniref:carbohydrate ABC transporter permease n=1 Tax=Streptomyces sp. NPDC048636 TaxID=3155762 RepID=UPI00342556D6
MSTTLGPREGVGVKTVRPPHRSGKRRRSPMRVHWAMYLFPLPAVALSVVFFFLPLLQSFQYALTDWNGYSPSFNYVGFDNFVKALTGDSLFTNALENNLKFLIVVVVVQTFFALLLALLLVRNTRGSVVLRALFFFPAILSSIAVGFIWKFVYDPSFGMANTTLEKVGLGSLQGSYLGDPGSAMVWVAIVQVWFHAGQLMTVFIAGLQLIPRELYEAAELDGAGRWQQFKSVTWPMIAPATAIVVAYTTIQCFMAFDLILGMVGNPPSNAQDILSTRIYSTFANSAYGYAAAQSIIFMLLIGIVVVVQRRMLRLTQKDT